MKIKTESKNEILWPAIIGFDRFLIVVMMITLLAMGIQGVSAETLTGTIGGSSWNTTDYVLGSGLGGSCYFEAIRVMDIEKTADLKTIINWWPNYIPSFDSGAPPGAQTSVVLRLSNNTFSGTEHPTNITGPIIGTGQLQYARIFNTAIPSTEVYNGSIALTLDTWNVTGLTGNQVVYLEYSRSSLYNITGASFSAADAPTGFSEFLGAIGGNIKAVSGLYTQNKETSAYAYYSVDKPSGLGISGFVNKTNGADGSLLYSSRIFITDVDHKTITNDQFLSTTPLYINTNKNQIYVCLLNAEDTWYNSSLLFTPGGTTPTPTPTPTVTPPPTGTFDIQFYVKDNGNSTPLENTYVELHRNDVFDSVLAGYTDVNGLITFAGVPRPNYSAGHNQMESRYWKTGYQYSTWSFNPTQIGNYFHTQYLVPDIGENPLVPATVNITVHSIDGSNGNANLASAYVEVYPNSPGPGGVIDWTYKLTGFTNASGLITFQNVPASAYNEIKTTKSGYSTDDYWIGVTPLSDFQHNAYLTTFGVTPTPTPLPQTGNYTLVISPTTVPYNGNTTGTISSVNDPTLAGIQQIWYAYGDPMSDPVNAFDFFESGSYSKALQYIKTGGNWMGWDYATNTFSNNKGATIPNPNDLIFNGPGGTKTVYCTITLTNGIQYDLLGTVVVGAGAGQITTNVHSIDALTGGQLFNVKIDILNENTGAWKNGTYPAGQASITTPAGTYLSFYGYLAGWNNATSLHKIAVASPSYQLRFYETGVSPGAGNQTFHITVEDQSGNPLSGAVVAITEVGNATQTKATAEGGTTSFTLKQSTTYTYRVTKIGYSIGAGSFSTDTADVGSTHIQLTKLAVTTPPTPTITPVIIPTGTAGNYSGFWGPIAEGAKGAGAATNEIPLLLAALLIFIGFCVGGWSGAAYSPNSAFNGQASLGGGVFGFVLSCMFGFIPIVWVISIIIIGIFVFIFFTRS